MEIHSEKVSQKQESHREHEKLDRLRMKWILFWVFLSIFVAATVGILAVIFVNGHPTSEERGALFKVFIVEVGAAILALFFNVFSLKNEKNALKNQSNQEGEKEDGVIDLDYLSAKPIKHQFELSPQPERIFTRISVIFASISALVTVAEMFSQAIPVWLFVVNNFLIFCVLLILTLFFFLRYRQVLADYAEQGATFNHNFQLLNKLIADQSQFYHEVMSHTREAFYTKFGDGIYPYRFSYLKPGLREIMEKALEKTVAIVAKMVKNELEMRRISEVVSLSVKVRVTGEMAKSLCRLDKKAKASVRDEELYIITLARDSDTTTLFSDREVRREVYEITNNTDFARIESGHNIFLSNDLQELERKGDYLNNNPRWKEWYNATLVVPILHRKEDAARPSIYGFLTVDSKNLKRDDLFTRDGTRPIMAFGADLLALIFLSLEIFDKLPEEGTA